MEHDSALAEQQLNRGENFIPSIIEPKVPITLVWDNNDFREETLSGKGTTHNTNGIIIQRQSNSPVSTSEISTECVEIVKSKKRKRSLEAPPLNLSVYLGGKRGSPKPFGGNIVLDLDHYEPFKKKAKCTDAAYFFTKLPGMEKQIMPGWTGFNIKLVEKIVLQLLMLVTYQ